METNENYFEGIDITEKTFFRKFCKIKKVEPEYSESFFNELIQQLGGELKEKKEVREKKRVPIHYIAFVTGEPKSRLSPSFATDYEKTLQRILSICEKIKTNIWVYGSKEDREKKEITLKGIKLSPQETEIKFIIDKYNFDIFNLSKDQCLQISNKIATKAEGNESKIGSVRSAVSRIIAKEGKEIALKKTLK